MADEAAQAVQGAAPTGAPGPEDQAAKEAVKQQASTDVAAAESGTPVSEPGAAAPAEEPYVPQPVDWHDGSESDVSMPTGEEDQMLFGPTAHPEEHIAAGATPEDRNAPPADIEKWLPSLNAAASDPNAPELIKNLAALVNYHLGK